jgi:hypothetical protein
MFHESVPGGPQIWAKQKKEPQEMSRGSPDEMMSLLPCAFFTFHLQADTAAAEARTSFFIIEPVCV